MTAFSNIIINRLSPEIGLGIVTDLKTIYRNTESDAVSYVVQSDPRDIYLFLLVVYKIIQNIYIHTLCMYVCMLYACMYYICKYVCMYIIEGVV